MELPNDKETENAVLGAVLLNGELIDEVLQILKPEDFYHTASQRIFQAMIDLSLEGVKIDLISVTDQLQKVGKLEAVGGPGKVARLTDSIPISANIVYYSQIIKGLSQRRKIYNLSAELKKQIFDPTHDSRELIEYAEQKIFEIAGQNIVSSYTTSDSVLTDAVKKVEQWHVERGKLSGIPSGFYQLDDITDGFQNAEFIVIGARPSVGKSSIVLNMTTNLILRKNLRVGFFSLEMPAIHLMIRMFSSEARVDSFKIKRGNMLDEDFKRIMDIVNKIYGTKLFINDTSNIRLLDLRSQARRMKSKEDIIILFIDYISLITPENRNIPRHEQIAEVSRSLKALAKELNIPVIAVSQLRREVEGRRPTIADLRESGSLEQDADVIILLHRENEEDNIIEVIIAKQRNGPRGMVKMKFIPEYTRFEKLASDYK